VFAGCPGQHIRVRFPIKAASCARTISSSGKMRRRPRRIRLSKSSSTARRSILGAGQLSFEQSFAEACRIRASFVELAHALMFSSAFQQVRVHRISMLQIVADGCVDFAKAQRWVLLEYFLRSRSLGESPDYGVEPNAASADSHDPIFIGSQRSRIS